MKITKSFKYVIFWVVLLLLGGAVDINAQCAMCKSAVESTLSNGRNMSAVGLNTGILYLLIAPYLLVAAVGFLWYRASKKNKLKRMAIEQQLINLNIIK